MKVTQFLLSLALAFGFVPTGLQAADLVQRGDVGLPQIEGPIAVSEASHPFDSAAHSEQPQDIAAQGYVEDEYLMRGTGRIFDLPLDDKLRRIADGPYVTRILVRRPRNVSRFNGTVIIEPLNSSMMVDSDLMWMLGRDQFMRDGDIWIGITYKPVSVAALKRFDPARYAALSLANPLPQGERCPDPEVKNSSDMEMGFEFDMLSQLGALVRSDAADNPLRDYPVARIFMTGFSQTAGIARAYAVSISPLVTAGGGKRIYDGYFMGGHAPFGNPFNNCDKVYSAGDPRLVVKPVGVPFIDLEVEGDVPVSRYLRRPDSDTAPDLYRRYEIAGGTHSGALFHQWGPGSEDQKRSDVRIGTPDGCIPPGKPPSAFPLNYPVDAIWRNLDEWVAKGVPPPHGEPIELQKLASGFDAAGHLVPVRDAEGNALGGVRSVAVDVPTASWYGARDGAPVCLRSGYGEPFTPAKLRELYPTHAIYVEKVKQAVQRLVDTRWLTEPDGKTIVAEAETARIP